MINESHKFLYVNRETWPFYSFGLCFVYLYRKENVSCLLIFCGGCRPVHGQRQRQPPECRPLSRSLAGSGPPVSGVDWVSFYLFIISLLSYDARPGFSFLSLFLSPILLCYPYSEWKASVYHRTYWAIFVIITAPLAVPNVPLLLMCYLHVRIAPKHI